MHDAPGPRDDLTERLAALGRQPIDPAVQSQHLTMLAGVPQTATFRSMLATRVKLGTAVVAGFLLGATGLASAGAMGPLQPIAKTTVEAVTPFELPEASDKGQATAAKNKNKNKNKGAGADDGTGAGATKNWADCAETFGGEPASRQNRGQYLKDARENGTPEEFEAARKSDCGKGLPSDDDTTPEADDAVEGTKGERGKPADKGKSGAPVVEDDTTSDDGTDDGEVKEDRSGTDAGKSGVTPPPTSTPVAPAASADARTGRDDRDAKRGGSGADAEAPAVVDEVDDDEDDTVTDDEGASTGS